ncbi:ATP-binding protein [Kitasatospora sp. NPDC088264]|uniref:ATP-binding protein n=1 Tax=Kitasatospora sp. NPDC088264 TaxID=3155296 RepID=UPI00341F83F0
MHRVLQIKTPLRTASVGAVRNLIRAWVRRLDGVTLDEDRAYGLLVASSEIVTNALKYGREHADENTDLFIDGYIDTRRRRVRVTVTDPRRTVPQMGSRAQDLSATGGRGITVVAGYADDVGWYQRLDANAQPVGWCVWFELDVQVDTGLVTATVAEVQPEPAMQTLMPQLKAVPRPARRGMARWHWLSRRRRERTAA